MNASSAPPEGQMDLGTIAYEAEQQAARAQAIIRALAVAAHEHMCDNHWLYCFEALDRLLARLLPFLPSRVVSG